MDPAIRVWTLDDLSAVQHILITTWLDAYASFVPEADLRFYHKQHYSLVALENLYRTKGVTGFVAEVRNTVVGFMRTQMNEEDGRFYVSSLYVLPGYQGMGLGTKLMKAAEQRALTYHADEVWLGVMSQNLPALQWYRGMGFQFVEEQPFAMGGTTVPHLIGFKKITGATGHMS